MPVAKRKKNGRRQWTADYDDGTGKRVQKVFPTKEQAEEHFAKAVITAQQKTTPDLPTTITFAAYVEHWRPLVDAHLKRATSQCYEQNLRLHLLPAFDGMRVRDIQRGQIKAFLVSRFGKDILLKPDAGGFGGLVWALPVVALLCGAAGLGFAFIRWRSRARVAATPADRALVEEALRT